MYSALTRAGSKLYTLFTGWGGAPAEETDYVVDLRTPDRAEVCERAREKAAVAPMPAPAPSHTEEIEETRGDGSGSGSGSGGGGDAIGTGEPEPESVAQTSIALNYVKVKVQTVTTRRGFFRAETSPTKGAMLSEVKPLCVTRYTTQDRRTVEDHEVEKTEDGNWRVLGDTSRCGIEVEKREREEWLGGGGVGGGGVHKCGGSGSLQEVIERKRPQRKKEEESWRHLEHDVRLAGATHRILGRDGFVTRPVNVLESVLLDRPVDSVKSRGVLVADRSRGETDLFTFDLRVDVTRRCRCLSGSRKETVWAADSFSVAL